jgi:hypothetical protein
MSQTVSKDIMRLTDSLIVDINQIVGSIDLFLSFKIKLDFFEESQFLTEKKHFVVSNISVVILTCSHNVH